MTVKNIARKIIESLLIKKSGDIDLIKMSSSLTTMYIPVRHLLNSE